MKNATKLAAVLLLLTMVLSFASCNETSTASSNTAADSIADTSDANTGTDADGEKIAAEGLWANATWRSDKSFGEGAKTVLVEVKAGDQSITFTVKTDAEKLGDALIAHGIIEGEDGQFGLYIKKVNGILADYDIDRSYWGFYKNGEYMMTGVDGTSIADGEHYELVYTK